MRLPDFSGPPNPLDDALQQLAQTRANLSRLAEERKSEMVVHERFETVPERMGQLAQGVASAFGGSAEPKHGGRHFSFRRSENIEDARHVPAPAAPSPIDEWLDQSLRESHYGTRPIPGPTPLARAAGYDDIRAPSPRAMSVEERIAAARANERYGMEHVWWPRRRLGVDQ